MQWVNWIQTWNPLALWSTNSTEYKGVERHYSVPIYSSDMAKLTCRINIHVARNTALAKLNKINNNPYFSRQIRSLKTQNGSHVPLFTIWYGFWNYKSFFWPADYLHNAVEELNSKLPTGWTAQREGLRLRGSFPPLLPPPHTHTHTHSLWHFK